MKPISILILIFITILLPACRAPTNVDEPRDNDFSGSTNNNRSADTQACQKSDFAREVSAIMSEMSNITEDVLETEHTGDRHALEDALRDYHNLENRISKMECRNRYPETHGQMLLAVYSFQDALEAFLDGNDDLASVNTRLGITFIQSVPEILENE